MTSKFRTAAPILSHRLILFVFSKFFASSLYAAQKFRVLGEMADYQLWLAKTFDKSDHFYRRENLWRKIVTSTPKATNIRIIELGVAWGYTTDWF